MLTLEKIRKLRKKAFQGKYKKKKSDQEIMKNIENFKKQYKQLVNLYVAANTGNIFKDTEK